MKRELRIGVVGCGSIAYRHVAGHQAAPRARIVSVFDLSPKAAEAMAKQTGADVAPSLKHMAQRHDLDAVSMCTPPAAHYQSARPFLAARIPILCEKPLAAEARDAARFAAAVKRSRTPFMIAYCHRFHPPVVELRKLIKRKTLGRPLFFRNIFAGDVNLKGNHRADPKIAGGGCLIDNGSHSVDLFRFLVGDPTHALAYTANLTQKLPVEDTNVMILDRAGDAAAEITSSYSLKGGSNWLEWYGTQGAALISYWNPGQPDLQFRVGDGKWTPVDCSKHPDRVSAEIAHFHQCVRTRRKPAVTVDDGLKAARIIAAAYRSAATGKRVRIRL